MRSTPAADEASNKSPHRQITPLPNTNKCGATRDDVLSSVHQYRVFPKTWNSTRQSTIRRWLSSVGSSCSSGGHWSKTDRESLDELSCISFIGNHSRICFSRRCTRYTQGLHYNNHSIIYIILIFTFTLYFHSGKNLYILFFCTVHKRWKSWVDPLSRLGTSWHYSIGNVHRIHFRESTSTAPILGNRHPRQFWSKPYPQGIWCRCFNSTGEHGPAIRPSNPPAHDPLRIKSTIMRHLNPANFRWSHKRNQYPLGDAYVSWSISFSQVLILSNATNIWHMSHLSYHHILHFLDQRQFQHISISLVQPFTRPIQHRGRTRKSCYSNPASKMRIFQAASILMLLWRWNAQGNDRVRYLVVIDIARLFIINLCSWSKCSSGCCACLHLTSNT